MATGVGGGSGTAVVSIEYKSIRSEDYEQVRAFLSENGWAHRVADPAAFTKMLDQTDRTVVAWQEGRVVGFARALCDGVSNGYLSMVVVAEAVRGQGVGREIVQRLMGNDPQLTWVLRAGHGSEGFWSKMGFTASKIAMESTRQPKPAVRSEMEEAIYEPENRSSELYYEARQAMDAGQFETAVGLFQQSIDTHPHFKTLELLGQCLIALGRPQEAIVPLAAAATLNNGVRAPALLAEVFWELGQKTGAERLAEIALARDPNNKKARMVKEKLGNDTDTQPEN